jgi:Na+/glutamate symporter
MLVYDIKKYFLIVFSIASISIYLCGSITLIELDHYLIKNLLFSACAMVVVAIFCMQLFIRFCGENFSFK